MDDSNKKFVVVEYLHKGTMFVSAAPKKWVNGTKCAWPKKDKDVRKAIRESHEPSEDWTIFEDVKILGEYATFKDANFHEWKFSKTEDESEELDEIKIRPKRKVKPSSKFRDDSFSPPPNIKGKSRKQRSQSSSLEDAALIPSPVASPVASPKCNRVRQVSSNVAGPSRPIDSNNNNNMSGMNRVERLTVNRQNNPTSTSTPKLRKSMQYEDEDDGPEAIEVLDRVLNCSQSSFEEILRNSQIDIGELETNNETQNDILGDVSVRTNQLPSNKGKDKVHHLTDSTKILEAFLEIKEILQVMDARLKTIEDAVQNKFFVPEHKDKNEIAQLIPVKSIDELEQLENKLLEESNKEKLVYVLQYIGGIDSKSCILRCLDKLFTNQCAMLCSWTGKKNNYKIKDLKIMQVLKDSVRQSHPTTKDDLFEKVVMNWLQFAKVRHNRGKL